MVSRIIAIPILVAAVVAPVLADNFELSNLDDGKWEFSRGSPDCPKEIKIDTEDSAISAKVLEAGQTGNKLVDCTGKGKVDLIKAPKGGNAFQKAIADEKDSAPIWGGEQTGAIKCGRLDIPATTFWQFFSPEDEFTVNPSQTLGGTNANLAADSDKDIEFQEDRYYLVLGDLCVYKRETRGKKKTDTEETPQSIVYSCRLCLARVLFGRTRSDFNALIFFFVAVTGSCFFFLSIRKLRASLSLPAIWSTTLKTLSVSPLTQLLRSVTAELRRWRTSRSATR